MYTNKEWIFLKDQKRKHTTEVKMSRYERTKPQRVESKID